MDVKLLNAQSPITVPVAYQRSVQALQRASFQTSLLSSDDVIDCVELQTGKHSPANTYVPGYKPSGNLPLKDKGTCIDIWA
jgi:hypothetical protein